MPACTTCRAVDGGLYSRSRITHRAVKQVGRHTPGSVYWTESQVVHVGDDGLCDVCRAAESDTVSAS